LLVIIFVLCSGCYAGRAYSGRNIGLMEEVRCISLKDSTIIFINSPLIITTDNFNNNLIFKTSKDIELRTIPQNQVSSINSRHFSRGYPFKARRIGLLFFLLQLFR